VTIILTVALLCAVQLGSQSTTPVISITAIPAWGQDGQVTGAISGVVSQLNLWLFAFVPDVGWVYLPQGCGPVPMQGGQFSVNAAPSIIQRYATRYSAYLVPATLMIPCNNPTPSIDFGIQRNAVASATIMRLPQYSTISFGGLEWFVKDAPVQVSPGPQFFIKDNVFVDSFGQLHLKLTPCGNTWCASEIYTKQTVGYGTYRFVVNTAAGSIDPNVTLGLFSWDAQAADQNNREWDIEFGKWGNPNANTNAQFVVQPYNGPNNIQRFLLGPFAPSTHTVSWSASQVGFASSHSGGTVSQWTFNGGVIPVPTPGDVHLHINFYLAMGPSPRVNAPQEVVIGGFQYTPAVQQIGFGRTVDNIPYQAQSYSVPLSSGGSACTAQVESDSPWLTVPGSNVIPPGATLRYVVGANVGSPRSGNLILQSTTCNAALGAQVLNVTQAGLVCSPSFASPSTHLGFLQNVFSVLIRGTDPVCSWTVQSSAPWLHLTSAPSGAGDGSVTVAADANGDAALRGAVLALNNGPVHSIYQDGAGVSLALSPAQAMSCGGTTAKFGLSWIAPGNVEIHSKLPDGPLIGQFGPAGTTTLSDVADGTVIFMVLSQGASTGSGVLASARASVVTGCSAAAIMPLGVVNGASFSANSLAPGAFATIFGSNLSGGTAQASTPYPSSLGGVTVSLAGQQCPLAYVSPGQINFLVPSSIAPGRYTLKVGAATSEVLIMNVSPGIFTLSGDGTGVPLAGLMATLDDGSTVPLAPYQCSGSGCTPIAIALPPNATDLYIVLYGTGIQNYRAVSAALGANKPEVAYVGAQAQFPGLDQVNLHLKSPFHLTGTQLLQLQVDGVSSNAVSLMFQ
jgi:uncharacterized protein (TIGR03437 family)